MWSEESRRQQRGASEQHLARVDSDTAWERGLQSGTTKVSRIITGGSKHQQDFLYNGQKEVHQPVANDRAGKKVKQVLESPASISGMPV